MPFHGGVTGNNRHINVIICLRQATLLNQANLCIGLIFLYLYN